MLPSRGSEREPKNLASHIEKLAARKVSHVLGQVRPLSARHLLEKMLNHDPEERPSLDEVARHAWLGGGLDTAELSSSFSGLQQAQELTQRQLGTLNAWLRSNSLADA